MYLKNTRPTIIELPNGYKMQPGEEMSVTDDQMATLRKNPAIRIWMQPSVGFLEIVENRSEAYRGPTTEDLAMAAGEALADSLGSDPTGYGYDSKDTSQGSSMTANPAQVPPPKKDALEPTPAIVEPVTRPDKWKRVQAVSTMTADEVIAAAGSEDDQDVISALNKRADFLGKNSER